MRGLSPAQIKVLSALWAAWDAIHEEGDEETRRYYDERGMNAYPGRFELIRKGVHSYVKAPYPTLWALHGAGYIKLTPETHEHSDLRRGYFGRWIGGTVSHTEVTFKVIPVHHSAKEV